MAETPVSPASGEKWYRKKSAAVVAFFVFPPLAIPFIWLSPRTGTARKIIYTVVLAAATWALWIVTKDSYDKMMKQVAELKQMGISLGI